MYVVAGFFIYSRFPSIRLLIFWTAHSLENEENSPKTGSFAIDNVQQVYQIHDFVLCNLNFVEPFKLLERMSSKESRMNKQGTA